MSPPATVPRHVFSGTLCHIAEGSTTGSAPRTAVGQTCSP